MQGDLISRSDLVRHLVNWQMESFSKVGHEKEYNLLDMIIRGVENEPTAYDVEKVIKQIGEVKLGGRCDAGVVAKEIVRNGGKE